PPDVTSDCQPFFWHFFALVELPASAVPPTVRAASSSPAVTAASAERRKGRRRMRASVVPVLVRDISVSLFVVRWETRASQRVGAATRAGAAAPRSVSRRLGGGYPPQQPDRLVRFCYGKRTDEST